MTIRHLIRDLFFPNFDMYCREYPDWNQPVRFHHLNHDNALTTLLLKQSCTALLSLIPHCSQRWSAPYPQLDRMWSPQSPLSFVFSCSGGLIDVSYFTNANWCLKMLIDHFCLCLAKPLPHYWFLYWNHLLIYYYFLIFWFRVSVFRFLKEIMTFK